MATVIEIETRVKEVRMEGLVSVNADFPKWRALWTNTLLTLLATGPTQNRQALSRVPATDGYWLLVGYGERQWYLGDHPRLSLP